MLLFAYEDMHEIFRYPLRTIYYAREIHYAIKEKQKIRIEGSISKVGILRALSLAHHIFEYWTIKVTYE